MSFTGNELGDKRAPVLADALKLNTSLTSIVLITMETVVPFRVRVDELMTRNY
jgi:hypothetical protein